MTDAYRTVLVQLDSRYNPSNLSMIEQQIYENFKITGSVSTRSIIPMNMCCFWRTAKRRITPNVYPPGRQIWGCVRSGHGKSAKLTRQHESYESAKIAIQRSLGEQKRSRSLWWTWPGILLGSVPADTRDFFETRFALWMKKIRQFSKPTSTVTSHWKKPVIFSLSTETHFEYQLEKIRNSSGYDPRTLRGATILYLALELEKYVWSALWSAGGTSSFKLKTSLQKSEELPLNVIKTKRISWHEHANKTFWMTDYFEIHQS